MNATAYETEAGIFHTDSDSDEGSWSNVFLAFAVDRRFRTECSGNKNSLLCTFFHSSANVNLNLTWAPEAGSVLESGRYEVVLLPVEFIMGKFGREGPDLSVTSTAAYVDAGFRAEYLRDLGLAVENRVVGAVRVGVNLAAPVPLARDLRWIGSVHFSGGGSSTDFGGRPFQGAITGGIEGLIGLALDLERGTVILTESHRQSGDLHFNGNTTAIASNRIELKYLRYVCGDRPGCRGPHRMELGGGLRYESSSLAHENGDAGLDHNVRRLIFFAEVSRF